VTPWIAKSVLPKLPPPGDPLWKSREQIRDDLVEFVIGEDIEFWTMCAWSDWSLVVRLFGRFEDTPKSWPMACWDLWQLEAELGVTRTERLPEPEGVHNALIDARYHRRIYESLRACSQRDQLDSVGPKTPRDERNGSTGWSQRRLADDQGSGAVVPHLNV
jgi:hypothetical protein